MEQRKSGCIVKALSGFYYVRTEDGEITECRARGIFRKEKITPLVGDQVEFVTERGRGTVDKIYPRRNSFVRPAVSNLDVLVILASGANPVTALLSSSRSSPKSKHIQNRFFVYVSYEIQALFEYGFEDQKGMCH